MSDALLGVERSVRGRRWRPRLRDDRLAAALARRLDLDDIVARVLAGRGIGPDEAASFLDPTLRALLPDPSSLADMDAAAARLADAVMAGEPIGIFGDYDVDGATSAALLVRFIEAVGGRALVHIPDRMREGYGPSVGALVSLRDRGAGVFVTVDCGISAFEPLKLAAEAGLEVIVLDHHAAEARLPAAAAVVNPNRIDDRSGAGMLAAVGVAFLAAVALNRELKRRGHHGARAAPDLRSWLDLVALGTVCDCVPLVGINRALVRQGLKVMAARDNRGLAALADVAGLTEPPGAYHAGFVLGPRINAGGRIGEPDLGVRLLTTRDPDEAAGLALRLDGLNRERREIEAEVLRAALERAEAQAEAACIVVAGEGWHAGVIGIVASRLVERYDRPALVIAVSNGEGRGSGRSLAGIDLGAAVTAARQAGLLANGGGHAMAAGLTVATSRIDELTAHLRRRLEPAVRARPPVAELGLDGALAVGGARAELIAALERVGPFGVGNAEPRLAVAAARVLRPDVVGGSHVRCVLAGADGGRLRAIAFRAAEEPLGRALLEGDGRPFHLAGKLRFNRWRGDAVPQLVLDDAAPAR